MMTRRHLLTASAASLAFSATGLVPHGFAQLGRKTARILVGFPAGGNADLVARLLANDMKGYSSAVIVEIQRCGRLDHDAQPRSHDSALSAHL